mgnify:CR=1 FL=1
MKSLSWILGLFVLGNLTATAAQADVSFAPSPTEPQRLARSGKTVSTFTHSFNSTKVTMELRATNFSAEWTKLKPILQIVLKGINDPEFKQAILMFPDSFWASTKRTSRQVYNDIVNHHHRVILGTTLRPMRLVATYSNRVIFVEKSPRKNVFDDYKNLKQYVPYIANGILHEMIHLVRDRSRKGRPGKTYGYIHHQNYNCDLKVQRSVPYTFANTFDAFLRYKISRIKKKSITYKDILKALTNRLQPMTLADGTSAMVELKLPLSKNRFLTRFLIHNKGSQEIRTLSLTYNYTGCSAKQITHTFTTKGGLKGFTPIKKGAHGFFYTVPIYYWGIKAITLGTHLFSLGDIFPFKKQIPYCSTLMGRDVSLVRSSTRLLLRSYKTQR